MNPEVYLFVVCEEARQDPASTLRIDLRGIYRNLRSTADPPFPCLASSLTAFALFNYNGEAEVQLRIVDASTNGLLAGTPQRRMRFVASATDAIPLRWKITSVRFPRAGEYGVELSFDGTLAARWSIFITS